MEEEYYHPENIEQPKLRRVEYDGELSQITRIWAVNLALFFATLSFYRFWGRTRIRQYVWSHTSVLGSRLEYTGTGGELLKGFLIILPLYILLSFLNGIFPQAGAGFTIFFILIGFFAIFSGLRYRVTRSLWRGIRGHMDKDGYNAYQNLSLKRHFIDFISLGITIPRSQLLRWQCLVQNVSIGNQRTQFFFDCSGLALSNFLTLVLGFIAALIVNGVAAAFFIGLLSVDTPSDSEGISALFIIATVLSLACGYLAFYAVRQYYLADLARRRFSGILIGRVRFYTFYTRGQFIRFKIINMIIILISLGLGAAFVLHRKAQFFGTYLATAGEFTDEEINNMHDDSNTVAEGFLDSFGFDIGIFS